MSLCDRLKKQGYRAVPLERKRGSNFLWVTVTVQESKRQFVLDTGTNHTILDLGAAKDLKIPLSRTDVAQSAGPVAGGQDVYASPWQTVTVGDRAIPLAYLVVSDLSMVTRQLGDEKLRVDGLIGSDILSAYSAVIDYPMATLYLLDPTVGWAEVQGEWRGVESEHRGKKYAADHAKLFKLTVRGTALRYDIGGVTTDYRVTFSAHDEPKQMTWYTSTGGSTQAIYELTRDGKLRIAAPLYEGDDKSRPKGFVPPKEKGFAVITLERVAPNK